MAAVDALPDENIRPGNIEVQLTQPIVVFQGPIYRVEEVEGAPKLEEVEHLHFHHVASLHNRVVPVQIDVVTEGAFPKLMGTILQELKFAQPAYQRTL